MHCKYNFCYFQTKKSKNNEKTEKKVVALTYDKDTPPGEKKDISG